MLTKKMLFERIEACNGSVDAFLKESLGRYAYVDVQENRIAQNMKAEI